MSSLKTKNESFSSIEFDIKKWRDEDHIFQKKIYVISSDISRFIWEIINFMKKNVILLVCLLIHREFITMTILIFHVDDFFTRESIIFNRHDTTVFHQYQDFFWSGRPTTQGHRYWDSVIIVSPSIHPLIEHVRLHVIFQRLTNYFLKSSKYGWWSERLFKSSVQISETSIYVLV